MKRPADTNRALHAHGQGGGPSQRQLRAGELIRHALVDVLREHPVNDPDLEGVSVTLTEVRMSPDLRNATVFVEPLGGDHAQTVVKALNRHHKYLRGRLGHAIALKFTPALKFLHDESFDEAARMNRLFDDPRVARDLRPAPSVAFGDSSPSGGATKEPSSSPSGGGGQSTPSGGGSRSEGGAGRNATGQGRRGS